MQEISTLFGRRNAFWKRDSLKEISTDWKKSRQILEEIAHWPFSPQAAQDVNLTFIVRSSNVHMA